VSIVIAHYQSLTGIAWPMSHPLEPVDPKVFMLTCYIRPQQQTAALDSDASVCAIVAELTRCLH
jgi:hypothetical protein